MRAARLRPKSSLCEPNKKNLHNDRPAWHRHRSPRPRVLPPHGLQVRDKVFLIPGRGDAVLPLVYIDSLVDGAIIAAHSDAAQGKVYNLVDDGNVIVADYIRRFIQQTKLGSKCFRLPFFIIYCGALAYEVISAFGL